jgi:hypothetical protein
MNRTKDKISLRYALNWLRKNLKKSLVGIANFSVSFVSDYPWAGLASANFFCSGPIRAASAFSFRASPKPRGIVCEFE